MTPTTDIVLPAWIWHGQDVHAVTHGLASRWAKSPQTAAMWLSRQPGIDTSTVVAWVRVMKQAVISAADRNAPTVEEIQDVVRFAQRHGW